MFSFSVKRLISIIFASLLPVLVMLFGLFLVIAGTILNFSVVVAYFVVPLVGCGLLGLLIFSELSTFKKVFLTILILAVFLVGMFFGLFFVEHERVQFYPVDEFSADKLENASLLAQLPSLDEIGDPLDATYAEYFQAELIFSWNAYYMICTYDDASYWTEKEKLEEKYVYQDGTIYDNLGGTVYSCHPSADINGYTFRLLSIDAYDLYYPKNIILNGYCDDTREIVYIAFYDIELDMITSLEEFILDDCGWEHIR